MLKYRFSPGFIAEWVISGLFQPHRDAARDARRALKPYRGRIHVTGLEHVPADSTFVVASNHYSRAGFGTWWTALAVTDAVAAVRPDLRMRWLHTDRFGAYRLFGRVTITEGMMAPILRWIAQRYGFLQVARDEIGPRAPMLREAYRALRSGDACLAIMPEGQSTYPDGRLGVSKPGAHAALAWLTAAQLPVVPVAVFDAADGGLVTTFGPAFYLARPERGEEVSGAADRALMTHIAALMPAHLRGDAVRAA